MDKAIELSDYIAALRRNFTEALHEGAGEELRFEAGPVELELVIGVEKATGPEAKVRFWVFDIGASWKRTRISTQRLKVTLAPRLAASPAARPLITGESLPDER